MPESELKGMILSYTPGGIVRYQSGQRNGNTVSIVTTVYPRFQVAGTWNGSLFGCLGQTAQMDQLGSVSPPSTVKILNGTQDVTREATMYSYVPSGKGKPILNPTQAGQLGLPRYYKNPVTASSFTPTGELKLPGNMGCEIIISYHNYRELTAVFTLWSPPVIRVSVLGHQDFTFHSYLGVGAAGHLQSLVDQLHAAGYADRHEKFPLSIPARADYFLLNFPPTSADAYTAFPNNLLDNLDRLSGGTYRIVIPPGLSVDHVNSMGLPLYGHWQDSDQAGGQFLNYAKSPLRLAAPEYFLPPGVPYQACMTDGGCSAALLNQVYHTPATMRMLYLQVERTSAAAERYPTQMVGPAWSPTLAAAQPVSAARHVGIIYNHSIYLPVVQYIPGPPPPDDVTGCSPLGGCGWFTADGRMVDYIPLR